MVRFGAIAPLALVLTPAPARWLDLPAQFAAHGGAAVVLVGAAIAILRWRLGAQVAALGCAALVGAWLVPGRAPMRPDAQGLRLRIVTYNMAGQTSLRDEAFYDWLDAQDADLVCLVHPPWPLPSRRTTLEERFPHRITPRPGLSWAVVLLSRFPAEIRGVDLPGDSDRFSFAANRTLELALPSGASVLFSGAYHASPRTGAQWSRGVREAERDGLALRALMDDTGLPCIAAGDFNTGPLGRSFATFHRASGLRSAQRLFGSGTWPSSWPRRLSASIDHVWISEGVALAGVRSGPRFASDHRPLVVDVVVETGAGAR